MPKISVSKRPVRWKFLAYEQEYSFHEGEVAAGEESDLIQRVGRCSFIV